MIDLVKKQEVTYYSPSPINASKDVIESFAEQVAEKLGYESGADLDPIITALGGTLYLSDTIELGDYESGTLVVNGYRDFKIYISQYTSTLRDRFTIAHELGHYLIHSRNGQIPMIVNRADSNRLEWEANWFAAAFLMPKAEVIRIAQEFHNRLYEMANYFKVSAKAMQVRCESLGINSLV